MAIRRCPYCKSIIDEASEYCSNCGTQLLFPEDESIEEEIPGERLIDEDIEAEPVEEIKKPARAKRGSKKKKKKPAEEKKTAEKIELVEEEPPEPDEEKAEEETEVEEEEEKELPEVQAGEIEAEEELHPELEEERMEEPDLPESEEETPFDEEIPEDEEAPAPEKKAPSKSESLKFETEDLDQLPDARTKEREEMEKILKSFGGEEGEKPEDFIEDRTPPVEDYEEAPVSAEEQAAGVQSEEEKEPAPEAEAEEEDEEEEDEEEEDEEEEDELVELPEYMKAPSGEEETPPDKYTRAEEESAEDIAEEERKEREDIERFLESVKKEREEKARAFKKKVMPTPEGGWEEEEIPYETTPETELTPEELIGLEEKEKEEIEQFVKSVKKERGRTEESFPLEAEVRGTPEEEMPAVQEEEISSAAEEEEAMPSGEVPENIPETGKELPPWAEKFKDSTPPQFEDTQEEIQHEAPAVPEVTIPEEEFMAPEPEEEVPVSKVKADLPETPEEERPVLEKKEEPERKVVVKRPPSRFVMRLKSRTFDFLSVAVFWLVSLWVASRLIGVSVYSIISISTLPVVGFYLIILLVYFIFFLIFLGESLGDYIFYQE